VSAIESQQQEESLGPDESSELLDSDLLFPVEPGFVVRTALMITFMGPTTQASYSTFEKYMSKARGIEWAQESNFNSIILLTNVFINCRS